jgi:16S rRNA (uracil1498-N3)-methyltransferase
LARVSNGEVVADVLNERTVVANRPRIILLQGLAKGSKVDLAIQKLVELGVDEIVVFTSSRSVPDWDETRRHEALERWRAIALEAAKQSRRAWLASLRGPLDIAGAADQFGGCEAAFVADPSAPTRLRDALFRVEAGEPGSVAAAVGPEGGLTEDEVAALSSANAVPVDLGGQILRSETASLALATILMFHFRLLG